MRVALLSGMHNALPPFYGGGGQRHLYALAEYFSSKGIECELISPAPKKEIPNAGIPKKINIHYVGAKNSMLPVLDEMQYAKNVYSKLREINSENKIDLVHAHASYAGKAALKFCKQHGIPFVFTQHNWRTWHYKPENLREKIRQLIDKRMVEMPILSRADCIFFVCDFMRGVISEKTRLNGRSWHIATNGVDTAVFNPKTSSKEFKKKYSIRGNDFVVCSVGRLAPEKNNRTLIEAFAAFAKNREDCKLLIAGSGDEHAALQELIDNLKIGGKAHLVGNLNLDELPALYAASEIFALPSYYECMPVAMLEAMSAGNAVIASRAGGIAEVIANGKNGLLLDSASSAEELKNKIELLYSNNKLRNALAKNAMKTIVESYQWEKIGTEVLECYKRLLKQS